MHLARWALALAVVATPTFAQSQSAPLSGQWQGTLPFGPQGFRVAVIFSKNASGQTEGEMFPVDQRAGGAPVRDLAVNRDDVKFFIPALNGGYAGVLNADKTTIAGTFTPQGGSGAPFELRKASGKDAWATGVSVAHAARKVMVEPGVDLEVLDWGGTGSPLIFLSGLPGTGHSFDQFAPNFVKTHHVYAITRRGMGGGTSTPSPIAANYSQDRLGDDILAVMDALKIDKAVLAGWSFAGSEMSNVATRRPERVAGLVYLDGAFDFAFYSPGIAGPNNILEQTAYLRQKAEALIYDITINGTSPQQKLDTLADMQKALTDLQADIAATQDYIKFQPPGQKRDNAQDRLYTLINSGVQKYPAVKVPVLAIYKGETKPPPNAPLPILQALQKDNERSALLAKRFQEGNPGARAVILSNAAHAVFQSNEADVLREMNAFMATLR